ncbi:MAG: hypothetical protein IJ833_10745 [Lachnospiraceae bacterium]|nr:hypothetical protein [Lachnospiraceae bacterium]
MGININMRQNTSYLFASLSGGNSNLNFLSDYASIKNGSYGKLMKAYYGNNANSSVKALAQKSNNNTKTKFETQQSTKDLAKVESAADGLKESADALLTTGTKSVFAEKNITSKDENGVETTSKGYDRDAIYNAVNKFVNNYNSVLQTAGGSSDTTIASRAQSLVNATAANEKMLNKIGITVQDDGTLSVDKDTLNKADISKLKTLFQGNGSYGYQASAQASMINYAASKAATKASTYTGSGTYGNAYNTGNIFSSYF